jgi:hypothetical protein
MRSGPAGLAHDQLGRKPLRNRAPAADQGQQFGDQKRPGLQRVLADGGERGVRMAPMAIMSLAANTASN